ncbi:DNA recombination protein RmuC [Hydrogenovibrio marinus]|uniref:Recombinase RmuC n=1 Tax=Hydrogenovibrio marinus TaxID=28885 RepID=A0A066ZZM0_HYDMR|nr:DNA recombination protein RmuC [Hydrogenovibrio marinus]KDN95565.1 recombinase RmuC [Hydrogenovibrio marinus]BBN60059.1 DNA recombination protein RmuC [Hydrogenovibrio marinus]
MFGIESAYLLPVLAIIAAGGLYVGYTATRALKQEKDKVEQLQQEYQTLSSRYAQIEQVAMTAENSLSVLQAKLEKMTEDEKDYVSQITRLETQQKSDRASFEEKLALLENAKQALTQEFKLLSTQIFEEKQAQINTQNKEALGAVLNPLQQSLTEFKNKIDQTHKADIEGRATLVEQLKQLKELNQTMSNEAKSLTQALKGDNKLQGNWGEMILEKMLESSGLRLGIEYEREKSLYSDDNKRLRPDVIVNLPDDKHIIIDSKVSLNAYESALNAEDDKTRVEQVKAHLVSLQKHIEALSIKRYDHIESLNAPDFVLMFIPIEGAYLMAIEQNPALFESAFEKNIAVVTPTTLFTTLKTIEQLWRYERRSENTSSLIKKAADVYDKFVGFVESFEKVGSQLESALSSYDQAKKRMVSGKGNLINQAQMLKDLAGKTKKDLPKHLVDEADVSLPELDKD